jgi:hypothetical protein
MSEARTARSDGATRRPEDEDGSLIPAVIYRLVE